MKLNHKIIASLILMLMPTLMSAEIKTQPAAEMNTGGDPDILRQVQAYLNDFTSDDLSASTSPSFDYLRININNIGALDYLIYPHTIYFCGSRGNCSLLAVLDSPNGDFRVVTELDHTGKPIIASRFASADFDQFSRILVSENIENQYFNDFLVPVSEGNIRIWTYDISTNSYVIKQN